MTLKNSAKMLRISRLFVISIYTLLSVGIIFVGSSKVFAESIVQGSGTWLQRSGVDIWTAGDGSNNYVTNINGSSTVSGYKWQCVELINRQYLVEGWTTATWSGNGNQLYANAPSNLAKETNGNIAYIAPGDVVTLDDSGFGHVGIVNSVTKSGSNYSVEVANQNTGSVFFTATLSGGTLSLPAGWGSYWVQGVVHAPTRMMIIDGSSDAYSEDFLGNSWTAQLTTVTVTQIAVGGSGRMMALDSNGTVYSKDYPTASWVTQVSSGAKAIAVGGKGRMMVIDSADNAYAKDGATDGWTQETTLGGITKIAVGGNGRQMIIDNSGTAYSNDSLANSWTSQVSGANAIAVGGNGRMMVINSANNVYAKDNPGDAWTQETGNGGMQKIAVGWNGRQMLIDSGNTAYHQDGLGSSWVSQLSGATAIGVGSNGRLMAIDSNGKAWGKDKPGDSWTGLTSNSGASKISINNN